jgi:RNA-directed DNA polymerase
MMLTAGFSAESGLNNKLDLIYIKSKENKVFNGIYEIAFNEVTITTAIHNIKANKGIKTKGIDEKTIDYYLQMKKEKLLEVIKKEVENYRPKPVKRIYIKKSNGKFRKIGISTILDRIIQECIRIAIEPIAEGKFYPHSYGFRPYRRQKDAINYTILTLNKGSKSKYVIEGDIKTYFDDIDHNILKRKLYRIGIADKRIIAMIMKMVKVGYIYLEEYATSESGFSQGSVLSPLMSNIYLNSFDWIIARKYLYQNRSITDSWARQKLRLKGYSPIVLIRFCDDWIIITDNIKAAYGILRFVDKYFKYKLKISLSEEKTLVTDVRKKSIKFLGFRAKLERRRITPSKPEEKIVAKAFPDPERVKTKINKVCEEIKSLTDHKTEESKAVQVERINSKIVGIGEYWSKVICNRVFKKFDSLVYNTTSKTFKKMYGKNMRRHKVPINQLSNRPNRHLKKYKANTWAIELEDMWIGITKISLTHSQRDSYCYDQKKTPYTNEGRKLKQKELSRRLKLSRPTLYDPEELTKYQHKLFNFEYFMNSEYAYNRDKGKCKICGKFLSKETRICHHINTKSPISKINKVPNLSWAHKSCYRLIHTNIPLTELKLTKKIISKIKKFRQQNCDKNK